jgi:hypothetical protein
MKQLLANRSGGKLTRRQLAGAAAGSAVVSLGALKAAAQAPATVPDFYKAARDSQQEDSAALANFEIPMSLEPAFQFKA